VTLPAAGGQTENNRHQAMRALIRSLPFSAEFAIVVVGAFGLFVFRSLQMLAFPTASPPITEVRLHGLLLYEPIVLAILGGFLHLRGWSTERLGLRPSLKGVFVGLLLACGAYAAYVVAWETAVVGLRLQPQLAGHSGEVAAHGLSVATVVAAALVNPCFEELFVCGYIVRSLQERERLLTGINISVALRLVYHLYQGSAGALSIVPTGLIFAWWYARRGQLWPVVVAHAALDFVGLLFYVR
jgi:membrane protease YdiL (CAAX protease family)